MELIKKNNELSYERWTFYFLDNSLFLDSYTLFKKEGNKNRKYNAVEHFNRLSHSKSTLKENEVPLTDEIKAEVLNQFILKIKVLKWSERNSYL